MTNSVSEHLQSMFSKMENFISTKTVVGDAVHFDNVIIVPLVEVSFGVGSGLGDSKDDSQGGGGVLGSKLSPVAVIVVIDGTVQLVDVKNKDSVNKLIDMIPGIISKFNLENIFKKKQDPPEGPTSTDGHGIPVPPGSQTSASSPNPQEQHEI